MRSLQDKKYRLRKLFTSNSSSREHGAHTDKLRFMLQKHLTSDLHYDFRIECGSVFKSWIVFKELSYNPHDKFLATMSKDYPLDYWGFEGVVPRNRYDAGTVMIWDEGTYEVPGSTNRHTSEEKILQGILRGHIAITLHGKKLRGGFAVMRMQPTKEKNFWFFIKTQDQFAHTGRYVFNPRSVRTGRRIEEIARTATKNNKTYDSILPGRNYAKAPKTPLPKNVRPMLATLVKEISDKKGWIYEIKLDGHRALAEISESGINLSSRTGQKMNESYQEIIDALGAMRHEMIIDGEIVILDREGKARFETLQAYSRTHEGTLVYYIFDILYLDGRDIRNLPLIQRKEILKKVITSSSILKLNDYVEKNGTAFLKTARQKGVEGIIAKDGRSPYRTGRRTSEWQKIKIRMQQEAIVAGFTDPKGSRKKIGALVLGVYENENLVYIGHAGGGFDKKSLKEMRQRLNVLVVDEVPFKNPPKTNAPVHWVRPETVVEVQFTEWTKNGNMRLPIFIGVRDDKNPKEVVREQSPS